MISVVRRFRCLLHEILAACCESSYCRFSMREPLWTYLACVDAYICWINYQPNMSFFPRVSWHGLPSAPRFTNHFTCLRITTWPSVSCSQFASLFYPLENKNRCFLIETFCIFTCWWLRWRCNIHPTWFRWWTHSTNFTSWGHGLSPPWNSISNRHGDPMLSNWMIYLGIVWNGSYGQQDSYRRVARLKKMFFCVCLTFKNIYIIYIIYITYITAYTVPLAYLHSTSFFRWNKKTAQGVRSENCCFGPNNELKSIGFGVNSQNYLT